MKLWENAKQARTYKSSITLNSSSFVRLFVGFFAASKGKTASIKHRTNHERMNLWTNKPKNGKIKIQPTWNQGRASVKFTLCSAQLSSDRVKQLHFVWNKQAFCQSREVINQNHGACALAFYFNSLSWVLFFFLFCSLFRYFWCWFFIPFFFFDLTREAWTELNSLRVYGPYRTTNS